MPYLDKAGLTYFWGKVKTIINGKVDKVTGKGLSTNDYTTAEKTKLSGIETQANKTTIANNLTTTVAGSALDATQGKALSDTKANKTDVVPNTIPRIAAVDDKSSYISGERKFQQGYYDGNSTGTKPFPDGFIDTHIWRNNNAQNDYISQIGYEDGYPMRMAMRGLNGTTWSAWQELVAGLGKGTHTLTFIITNGYITGSGNYVDFDVPYPISSDVTGGTISSLDCSVYGYDPSFTHTSMNNFTILHINGAHIWAEAHLTSAKTPMKPCTVLINSITFTLT